MSFYDIDYNEQAIELTPPDKRVRPNLQIIRALLQPLHWLRNLLFDSYKTGATAPAYNYLTTYAKYDQVQYKKSVYSSSIDNNTYRPETVGVWEVVQDNFIGVDERVLYNGTKLIFEFALNRWFMTIFRQLPGLSDIYLTTTAPPLRGFIAGGVQPSVVYRDHSSEFVINSFSNALAITLTIHIPVAVYNALSANVIERENIVRAFADRYVTLGIFYDIQTY